MLGRLHRFESLAAPIYYHPWSDIPQVPWSDVPQVPWSDVPQVPWSDIPQVAQTRNAAIDRSLFTSERTHEVDLPPKNWPRVNVRNWAKGRGYGWQGEGIRRSRPPFYNASAGTKLANCAYIPFGYTRPVVRSPSSVGSIGGPASGAVRRGSLRSEIAGSAYCGRVVTDPINGLTGRGVTIKSGRRGAVWAFEQ